MSQAIRGVLTAFRSASQAHAARSTRTTSLARQARRWDSTSVQQKPRASKSEGSLVEGTKTWAQLTPAEKVVEGSKDAGSVGVILAGFGICGTFLYAVTSHLFKKGPEDYFNNSFSMIKGHDTVHECLGPEIHARAPAVKSGRHTQWRAQTYEHEGSTYTRMQYEIYGDYGNGTVYVEMKKPKSGSEGIRYLFVDCHGMTGDQRVVLVDNRIEDNIE